MRFVFRHSGRCAAALLTALVLTLLAARGAAATDSPDVTVVTIGPGDVEALGGWPLNRKWYALAVQNLRRAGAARIYLDVAFPHPDVAHPESDEFFFRTLRDDEGVLLLSGEDALVEDSVHVLGSFRLPAHRFFAPFSSSFTLRGGHLVLTADAPRSFVQWLLPDERRSRRLLIPLPDRLSASGSPFLDAVRGTIGPVTGDVVVAVDVPGLTSYVAHGTDAPALATTALQVYAAQQVRRGAFATEWPATLLGLLFAAALAPLAVRGRRRYVWRSVSLVLCLTLPLLLRAAGVYVPAGWFTLALGPAGLLGYTAVRGGRSAATTTPLTTAPPPAEDQEIESLRYRLQFYEHLEQRTPGEAPAAPDGGLHYAPDSPLVPVLRKARKVAQTELSVLLLGESGVGKELLARYVHDHSPRADAPFLAINCAAVPSELIESELFGHEKGAFTGAQQRKMGLFERADGGTLFLDEIGETSTAFQAKLLRVLQEGTFVRVGGTRPLRTSVRVLAATHSDLPAAIEAGRFREDLYYRLHGITLSVPPLRERPDDVAHLFQTFLHDAGGTFRTSDALIEWLQAQPWPGNVRELKAATQRAIVNAELKRRTFLLPQDFELPGAVTPPAEERLSDQVLAELRRQGFRYRSISATAEALSIHRATVTAHLRGWVAHYLARCNGDLDRAAAALRGTADVDDAQLRKRLHNYADTIRAHIEEGLDEGETADEICLRRFRNVPQDFYADLKNLIERHHAQVG